MRSGWILCLILLTACAGGESLPVANSDELKAGPWRAWLESPGGELPFELLLERRETGWRAQLVNGPERLEVERVELEVGRLLLGIDHYDAEISADIHDGGARLQGEWHKTGEAGAVSRLPFHATVGEQARFASSPGSSSAAANIEGRWAVQFEKDEQPALGEFASAPDGTVTATFRTTTGDYRFLAGTFEAGRLRLSVFDGAHAFLFDATMLEDGTLAGDFWSRESWHETWTARRDDDVRMPDAFTLTEWVGGSLDETSYPDLDGNPRALNDEAFAGKARLLVVFGSWCPNCNDETRYLAQLHRRYAERGLSILGLAFEMTGSFDRDAAQVRSYAEHHDVAYPILIAGTSNKDEASRAFPLIDRVRSFPTTIFLDANDNVRAVHQGFNGPATGDAYAELQERFESLIENILAESEPEALG